MGAVLSLWEDRTSNWNDLPSQLQTKIYRDTQAERRLAAERHASAPGGWKHWLRNIPIGPAIENEVMNGVHFRHISYDAKLLMLRDITSVVSRFYWRPNDATYTLRNPVDMFLEEDPTGRVRINFRFIISWDAQYNWPDESSGWVQGRWFTRNWRNEYT